MRRHLAPLAALLLLAAAPATALGAPDWTSPVTIPPVEEASGEVHSGYQTGGGETQAFIELVSPLPDPKTVLRVRARPAGGAYAEQLQVASTADAIPVDVSLAVAPDGAAVVGWTELTGTDPTTAPRRFRAAYRAAGSSTWDAPVTVLTDTAHDSDVSNRISAVIAANGMAALGVSHLEPDDSPEPGAGQTDARLDVAVRPVGGPWAGAVRLNPANQSAESFTAAFDGEGNLTVAYLKRFSEGASNDDGDDEHTVAVRRRFASNGIFSSEEDISGSDAQWDANAPQLAVGPDGSAVIAYQYVSDSPKSLDVWGTSRAKAAGAWTEPVKLVTASSSSPQAVGVAPDGTAYAVYRYRGATSGLDCTAVVRGPAGGAFSPHRCVSPEGQDPAFAGVAFLGDDAVFAWVGNTPGNQDERFLQGSRWPAAAAQPETFRDLDTPGAKHVFEGQVVADLAGSIVVSYVSPDGRQKAVAYDAGAPFLTGASVPATSQAGAASTYTAGAFDLWSPLAPGQPTWDFGDGTPAVAGGSVGHAYAAPGAYTVTLRAADARGNTVARTFPVTVTPAAPGPGSGGGGGSSPKGPPAPAADSLAPLVKLTQPPKRKRKRASAWRTLKGTVADPAPSSGIASVEVAVYRTAGKRVFGLKGSRFKRTTAKKARRTFTKAKLAGGRWSLKLPKLKAGRYTILVRARDVAGNRSKAVKKTVRLK